MHLKTLILALAASAAAFPQLKTPKTHNNVRRANETNSDRLVFCHFMVSLAEKPLSPPRQTRAKLTGNKIGISGNRQSAADYDADMKQAKDLGIDAFALNIGLDSSTDTQLGYAYESAAKNDMKVFISFDFNWYSTDQAAAVGSKIAEYADKPAQLKVDNKVFVSSFAGDGIDVAQIKSSAGTDVFWAPNYHPGEGEFDDVDSALNWMAWDNDGNNKAPKEGANVTVADGDQAYLDALGNKPYFARKSVLGILMRQANKDSCIWLVLYTLRRRGGVQQELGIPWRPALVQSLERDTGARSPVRGDHHLERLWRVALHRASVIASH